MNLGKIMFEHIELSQYGEFFIRILIACFCGALIGFERSKRFKEAGIRTHIIVSSAAALMMIISKYGFVDLMDFPALDGSKGADPARIAAQIVSGVSFLGVGVIFHNGNTTKGLTTAAGIWATAGIGMAIGAGMYPLGIFVTLLIFVVQLLMHKIEIGGDAMYTSSLRFTVKNTEVFKKAFSAFLDEQHGQIVESKIKYDEEGYASYNLTLRTQRAISIEELSAFLESNGEVKSVSCISIN